MAVLSVPGYDLEPNAKQVALPSNYITDFSFINQYLPDTYEKEFERYGNRTVASFLRLVSAELPSNSDLIKWSEQGRLHTKYTNCTSGSAVTSNTATITVNDSDAPVQIALRVGQTVLLQDITNGTANRAIITAVSNQTFTVAYYETNGQAFAISTPVSVWIYGSEFKKGSDGMQGSNEAVSSFFSNSPIILKDDYKVSGSDMAQIGWVEVATENGATGYLWYLKSEHETRLRFEDYLETSMLEAVPAEANSGVIALTTGDLGNKGSEGVFYVVNTRGNVWGAGYPSTLTEFDTIVSRLDKQGAIEENVIFVNREYGFAIDDMLAGLNGYSASGAANAASFGLFDNDTDMALNLGFSGFRRGYDFYKSDWKYLNDPTMRGATSTNAAAKNSITGMLVPAGSTSVYDEVLGQNAKRPFLHVRYRATEAENRRYKTWVTGSAGGAKTTSGDYMRVDFLSERCICTLGANNFMLFRYGS